MARPSTITIPHALGVEEAKARLTTRVDWALDKCRAAGFEVEPGEWEGGLLPFEARAMGQAFTGQLEVGEDRVTLALALPFLLRMMLPMLEPIAKSYGEKLLGPAA